MIRTSSGTSMNCPNPKCKKEAPEGAAFCPWCGKNLNPPPRKTKNRGNGLGSVYKLKNNKWMAAKVVGWTVDPLPDDAPPGTIPHKRCIRVRRQYDTKKEALAALPFLTIADRRQKKGSATQRKKTSITLKELYDQWFPTHDRKKSTMNCYQSGFRIFEPLWAVRMDDIDIDDLQDCMDDSDVGRRTLENAKAALGLVYKYGIPRDAVPKDRNLAPFLRIREAGAGKKPGLSAEELEKVRQAAADGDPVARMVLCHCYLGFRPAGFLALTVSDYNKDERAFIGGVKTEAGIDRTVTVSPKVQPYVDEFLAAAGDGFIFGQAGKVLPIKKYRQAFYDLLDRLGIDNPVDEEGRHRLTPHSCRHTFATLMKRVKAPDTDKLALIGHASTDQLREYQDVPFADPRAITDKL